MRLRVVGGCLIGVTVLLSGTESSLAQTESAGDFFQTFSAEWVRHDPDVATRSRFLSGAEQDQLERQLTPWTLAARQDRIARARTGLTRLQRLDRASLSTTDRVSLDVMQRLLQDTVDEQPFLDLTFPLEQFQGANVNLIGALIASHPVRTEQDGRNYVARMGQISIRMREAITESQRLAARGILPPRFILDATIAQMESFIASEPAGNPLVATLDEKLSTTPAAAASRQALVKEAGHIVATEIYPAWRDAIRELRAQVPKSTNDAGLWRFKNGDQAYRYFLKRYTTTQLSPDEIHQLGLTRVAAIEQQMDAALKQLGRSTGSVKSRIEQLKKDREYPDLTGDESREQIMRDIDRILRDAQERAKALFDKTPRSEVVAQPVPRFREANAAASSSPPAADGSRPGLILFPRRIEWMTTFGLKSVIYHEGVPGHFFAGGLQTENRALPAFRQLRLVGTGFPAFGEGWGLYAERLAAESGWYGDDIEGQLGQLDWELFRARRLVVDTGLHAKHWTRQQAIDFGIEASEVERYVIYPGQACAYMLGELKILELREKAKAALGDRFSLKAYHNVVLETATVPLDVLESEVTRWVRESGGQW